MRPWFITVCLLLATATAVAQEPLNQNDKRLLRWFDAATLGDVVTTIVGAGCHTVREVNPILAGASPAGVIGFFVIRNVLHRAVTEAIPGEWRTVWLNSSIGVQTAVVLNNVTVLAKYC